MKLRVVLEKIRVMDSHHPALEDVEQLKVDVRVHTDNHGGIDQQTRLPRDDHIKPTSLWSYAIDEPIFEGEVEDHLSIRIDAVQADAEEPLGTYTREFSSNPDSWLGRYAPQEASGPENLGFWEVYYRIERAE